MTIASEITRIKTAIADAYIACQDMGATMPAVLNSDNLEQCIASISSGPVSQHWYNWDGPNTLQIGEIGELTTTATWTIFSNKDMYIGFTPNSDKYVYSTDGINWVEGSFPASKNWAGYYTEDNLYIIFERYTNNYIYSTNGINWIEGTLPMPSGSNYGTVGILKSDNYYLAYRSAYYSGSQSTFITKSTDGINWVQTGYGYLSQGYDGMIVFNNYFIRFKGGSFTYCEYSSNPSNTSWSTATIGTADYWYGAAGTSAVVAVGGTSVRRTTNVTSWSSVATLSFNGITPIYTNGIFLIRASGLGTDAVYSTDEGLTWNYTTCPALRINTYKDYFVGFDSTTNILYYSKDAINWSSIQLDTTESFNFNTSYSSKNLIIPSTTTTNAVNILEGASHVYTLDQNPTTSSVVYDLPETPSALTITGVGTGTITLSDSNTYTYNAEGDIDQ